MTFTGSTTAPLASDAVGDVCPGCGHPAGDGGGAPHRVTEDEAIELRARAGLYHDECCPECNGTTG